MSRLYNDKFADIIRSKIIAGEFKTKDDLIKYMQNINMMFFNDTELMKKIKDAGISLKYEDINALTRDLLAYYDQKNNDISNLNLDGVSQVKIGDSGKDYIKVDNGDGTYKLFDDSVNNDDFVKQFKDRQNESYNYQTGDGVKNKEQIIEDMGKDKTEVNLTSSNNVKTRELTPEERREFAAVMGIHNADEINFIVDTERNIYINKDNGNLFYTYKNNDGKIEVRKAKEVTADTVKNDTKTMNQNGEETNVTVEQSTEPNFENLDDYELQYIADNRFDSLTPEQKEALLRLLEKRKERTGEPVKENGYQKVLLMDILNKPHNGFTSILYLFVITLLFGIGLLLYLILRIHL